MSLAYVTAVVTETVSETLTVTAGDLLVFGGTDGLTTFNGVSDTQGNKWHTVFSGSNAAGIYYLAFAITKSSGSNTMTASIGSSSNPGTFCSEYSGAKFLQNPAFESLADDQKSVSCGPIALTTGVVGFCTNFAQASSYSSSSGSTVRTGYSRVFAFDNLTAHGSYTETGTLTGTMQYGGSVVLARFSQVPVGAGLLLGVG